MANRKVTCVLLKSFQALQPPFFTFLGCSTQLNYQCRLSYGSAKQKFSAFISINMFLYGFSFAVFWELMLPEASLRQHNIAAVCWICLSPSLLGGLTCLDSGERGEPLTQRRYWFQDVSSSYLSPKCQSDRLRSTGWCRNSASDFNPVTKKNGRSEVVVSSLLKPWSQHVWRM